MKKNYDLKHQKWSEKACCETSSDRALVHASFAFILLSPEVRCITSVLTPFRGRNAQNLRRSKGYRTVSY